ncbi:MAG: hypothetical protein A3H35_02210 [Betaproteobacteria bacterium RIFCSPLOWO2_02_FULL_62_17]|nr:MAG: hypothetical protein A3H35_02210 [Betaproteobacteria bacterium RIFCSPLOWO2_02_FULL_62_17]
MVIAILSEFSRRGKYSCATFVPWPRGAPHLDAMVKKLGPLTQETRIPITMEPRQFLTVIAGGAGKHSHYFVPFPRCSAVSKKVGE